MVVIKIFDAKDTNFNTAGNIIIEPLYCHEIKKKSLNGWYIDVEIPINYKKYIEQDKLCVVQTKSKLNPQAFRIKDIEYTTNKIVFQAQHVMFDAEDYFLLDSRPTNQNGLNVLNYINGMTDKVSPFTIYSNVENISTAYLIRKNLLEAWSIIEERWGGVFDADNWNISFLTSVGNDNGETIYYGQNLEDMKIIEDWSGVCTKLYPVGKDEIMLADKYLESTTQYDIPYTRTIKFDTQLNDEEQTEENLLNELKTNAINYLQENCVPKVCYEINSNINQEMEIGDIIQVKHPLCNISTEVLEYEYDVILGKITKLVFGNYSKDVKKKFKAVTNTIETIKEAVNKQQTTINNQTELINSLNKNGYVYIDENEILLLDAIPKEKAKNVWRFGLAGIGFSSNGYEGPFEVAMTMDGQINADFITTGTMSVSRIEGLANFISETEKQISEIEIEQGNITSRVSSLETTAENLQAQIDGSIQFWNGSEIPTVSNYPASEWTTEEAKNNHRADIYTVIEDVDGELKQGKSYRFDKVGDTWQWIELTDNELSAVQALATSKAKVFVTTPTVPYNVGDLWLNNGKLYRCKTAKDNAGSYSSSDWEIAVDYTDDTVANLAKTLANNAQSTADSAVEGVNNITNTQGEAEGKNIHIEDSAEEPFVDVELYGESNQNTRSGKNFFDKTKFKSIAFATYSYADGVYKIIPTGKGNARLEIYINLPAGTYTYSGNGSDVTQIKTSSDITIANNVSSSNTTFTITEEGTYIRFNWGTGTSTDAFTLDTNNIQIESGSTATDYEEYGVMPSPDYPSEIENIEGKNKLKNIYEAGYTTTTNGVTFTVNKDKSISIQGTANADTYLYLNSADIASFTEKIKKGKHTLSGCINGSATTYMLGIVLKTQDSIAGKYINSRTGAVTVNINDGDNTYYSYILVKSGTTVNTTIYPQLEEGSVATPYVPYNSLEFKVEGKNIFDCANSRIIYNNGNASYERLDNGLKLISSGAQYNIIYFLVDTVKNLKDKTLTLSSDISFSKDNQLTTFDLFYTDKNGGNKKTIVANPNITSEGKYQVTGQVKEGENRYYVCIGLRPNMASNYASGDYTIYDNLQVEFSSTATDYEPYKSQVVTFPLAEGQKLMEGSYLADDGIHHSRKQVVLDGTENWYQRWTSTTQNVFGCLDFLPDSLKFEGTTNNIICMCSHFVATHYDGGIGSIWDYRNNDNYPYLIAIIDSSGNPNVGEIVIKHKDITTVDELKTFLQEQYANGTPITVEYELAEPETVPYTEEQQEAWDKIKALMTYKNITNITSTAYAKVAYMRDNGLDVYETKQNAQKRYTETSEKLTEQKMTVDGVITQVSETNKRLTNDYLTAEQVNAELDTTKEDIEIIKQNQVTMTQTSKNLQIAIDTINNEGVSKVKTSMGYTFDDEGFKLNRSNAETGTIIDEAAVKVIDKTGASEQNLLYAGYVKEGNTNYPSYIGQTIVASANMIVQNYLVVPNSRFEEYTNPVLGGKGTGVFEV